MRSYSKRIVSVFFLLSGVIFLIGCSKKVDKKDKKLDTVIVAGSTEDANKRDGFYLKGKKAAKTTDINLNQVGYRRKDEKIAVVRNTGGAKKYRILDEEGNEVYTGDLKYGYTDYDYNETLYYADFTKFEEVGTYCIVCGDQVTSSLFEINDLVYNGITQVAIKPFAIEAYFKASLIDEQKDQDKKSQMERETLVKRSQSAKVIETKQKLDVSGGWCSTSNEGWFAVPSITSLANMMYLHKYDPKYIEKIPGQTKESNIKLDQMIREELEWLIKMQNTNSGGVYHKATTADGSLKDSDSIVYVSSISTCATADFAAITAKASMMYKESDANFSSQLLEASKKAWNYLKEHKSNSSFSNEEGITSRAYTDHNDEDERFWAATELYMATLEDEFLEAMKSMDIENSKVDFGWSLVTGYAYFDFYTMSEDKDTDLYKKVKTVLSKEVEQTKKQEDRGYLINPEYGESSLQELLNRGVLVTLMNQAEKKKDDKSVQYVHNYLNYIMGGNPESQNAFRSMYTEKSEQSLEISSALLLVLEGIQSQ